MKIIYRADDGAEFDSELACLEFEAEKDCVTRLREIFAEPTTMNALCIVDRMLSYKAEIIEILTACEKPTVGEWIDNSGVQPVACDVRVEVVLDAGCQAVACAGVLRWEILGNNADIVKWRLA